MAVRPGDAGGIIVVDGGRLWHVGVTEVEFFENVAEIGKKFDTFISCIDFGLGCAAGGDCLSTRGPVDGAVHPYEEARKGS